MIEILAPAGDEQCALAAINAGADAIYLGLTAFSARSSATNFGFEELEKIVAHAKVFGVKVYVAMNTLVKDDEVQSFVENAVKAWNSGIDAIIIQDIFLAKYIKQTYPQIKLNLSTQAGVNNVYGAMLAKEYGFDRVILARETKLEDIKKISEIIETEVFIQGALCTCFSGQCYLSSFAGGNSGNRGKCKQPCRKQYSIDRKGFEERAYRLSLSDLCVGEDIQKLIDAGVTSFKIEGRMRRPEYVSAAVSYYRNIVDGVANEKDKSALKRTYNRGNYTKGLAFGQDKSFISSAVQGHIGEFCGTVKVVNGKYICLSSQSGSIGDGFKILREGKEICGATFGGATKGGFFLNTNYHLKNGDKAFITTDVKLNASLLNKTKAKEIKLSARFVVGERACVNINGKEYFSDFILEKATSRPLSESDIKKCFDKTDVYPFDIEYASVEIVGDIFVAASQMNAFRRNVYACYYNSISENTNEKIDNVLLADAKIQKSNNGKLAVISCSLNNLNADIGILKPYDYFDCDYDELLKGFKGEKFLFMPVYIGMNELERLENIIEKFDGIYSDGYYAVALSKKLNKKLFAGSGFNIGNKVSLSMLQADYIALSKELTTKEERELSQENVFCFTAGDIKVMDLIYCPFEKTCKNCDKRERYELTDQNGRVFPIRRYKCGECRFEVYNCASLVSQNSFSGNLVDLTLTDEGAKVVSALGDIDKLKKIFKNFTKGHTENSVL